MIKYNIGIAPGSTGTVFTDSHDSQPKEYLERGSYNRKKKCFAALETVFCGSTHTCTCICKCITMTLENCMHISFIMAYFCLNCDLAGTH